jgi:methenyltetrahydrofolate cyclohydrolase
MKKFKNHTLEEYSKALAQKEPAPGGGSAAALTAALGVSLVVMAARYSLNKKTTASVLKKMKSIITRSEKIRKRLLLLVDLDAAAYLNLVKANKTTNRTKKAAARRQARDIPREVCRLCFAVIKNIPYLVVYGNKHLLSDLQAAGEMILAGYQGAKAMVEVNS